MIIVNVKVPVLEKNYDVQIDENVPMIIVIRDIADMISRENQYDVIQDKSRMLLWNDAIHRPVIREMTAAENGLQTGSSLTIA